MLRIRIFPLLFFAFATIFRADPSIGAQRAVGSDEDVTRIHLLHTNDIHGFLGARGATFMNPDFPPGLGGIASAARYIDRVRKEAAANGEGVLLLDAGDLFQGTRLGEMDDGASIIKFMNDLDYDAVAIGNHHFDSGWDNAHRLTRLAEFPVLGANIMLEGTTELAPWLQSTTMVETAGLKVGILGVCTRDTPSLTGPDDTDGLDFLPVDAVGQRAVDELREAGADLVIGIGHLGVAWDYQEKRATLDERLEARRTGESEFNLNAQELVSAVRGIDVQVCGHIHWGLREPYEDPVTHTVCVQTYGRFSGIGHVILRVDKRTGSLAGYELAHADGAEVTLFSDYIWPDPETKERIDSAIARAEAGMDEVLSILEEDLPRGSAEHPLGQVVTDAFLEATGADVAFTNRGGIRAELLRGTITPRELFEVLPFGNELEVFSVSGTDLLRMLETGVAGRRRDFQLGGATIVVDMARPTNERITECLIDGQPLDPDTTYEVVTTTYLASGSIGWDILTTFQSRATGMTDLAALEDYFRNRERVRHRFEIRIQKIGE